jgi:predicted lysophospholipase L1 biosynthesis ABC-type transport system permease subunit
VAVVNETLARRAFGAADPIGRRVAFRADGPFDIEIVGVVRDLCYEDLRESAPDGIFFPLAQIPKEEMESKNATGADDPMDLTVLVRMRDGQPMTKEGLLQQMLQFDSGLFVDRIQTFNEEANATLSQERMLASFGSVLGIAALALIVVGLYGTMTAAVIRSRRELGIRVALGASSGSLRAMVVTRCVMVAVAGLTVGVPLAYGATRTFAHMLHGVRPLDPLVSACTIAIVLFTAVAAASVPAYRAARVDPVVALRAE